MFVKTVVPLFAVNFAIKMKKFKEEESIEILRILDWINKMEKYQKDKYDWRKHKSRI